MQTSDINLSNMIVLLFFIYVIYEYNCFIHQNDKINFQNTDKKVNMLYLLFFNANT